MDHGDGEKKQMNWSRVRLLLIVCLLVTDCILGGMIIHRYRGENTVSRAALENVVTLLAENGIQLDASVVPTTITRDAVYRVPVSEEIYHTALSKMTGSPVSGIYLLPASTGMSVVFENGDRAEYYHNLYLTYTRNGDIPHDDDWAAICAAFDEPASDGAYIACNPMRDAAAKKAVEAAEMFLFALTYDEDSTVSLRPAADAVYTTPLDTVYLVEFHEEIGRGTGRRMSASLNGTRMRVLVEGDCIWYLAGTWVPCLPDAAYDVKKLDQINILFSELKRHSAAYMPTTDTAVPEDAAAEKLRIVGMQPVYYMLWDDAGHLYLRPAWDFLYETAVAEDGKRKRSEVLCDAVTGNVVSQTELVTPP